MALALDASTPAKWGEGTPLTTNRTSASFTAPSGALLVVCVGSDDTAGNTATFGVSDSGGLLWTRQIFINPEVGNGSGTTPPVAIYTATTVSAVAGTISVQRATGTATYENLWAKCYVVTGQHASPPDTWMNGNLS